VRQVPLTARVVEVIADSGGEARPRYRYGSGCIVAGRTVLTAAHVVTGAVSVEVRGPDKMLYRAAVEPSLVGDENGPGPDLALLELDEVSGVALPPMSLAAVDRDSLEAESVARCQAVGYPWFAETPSPRAVRDTADVNGHIPVLSKLVTGLLSLQVSSSPRTLPHAPGSLTESEWSGMSGAPVIAAGYLLGVVTEHAPREGASAITVAPLTALERDDGHPGWGPGVANPKGWWARLGVGDGGRAALTVLPRRRERPEPVHRATVREIRARGGPLIGRQSELRDIGEFATGPGGYRWVAGGAWAGKTTLLAEAVMTALPASVDAVAYFLSRREADADSNGFLAAVVPQLANLLGEDPPPMELGQFRALWQRAAKAAAVADRQLLLVVDGLDEDLHPAGSASVVDFLPAVVPDSAHVLVSSRFHPGLRPPVGHPLKVTPPVPLEPFPGSAELAALAEQEIDDLKRRDADGLALTVLGILTAAAGPLGVADLSILTEPSALPTPLHTSRVSRLVKEDAGRSLQRVGEAGDPRYQFAHGSLLELAQADPDLANFSFRRRIHDWAEQWRAAGWPASAAPGSAATPRYLLDAYATTLHDELPRLSALVTEVGWVDAAIQASGVDRVLADLRRASGARNQPAVEAMLAAVEDEAHALRTSNVNEDPGFVPRQLCLRARLVLDEDLASACTARLRDVPGPQLVPLWTTIGPATRGRLITKHRGAVTSVGVSKGGDRIVAANGMQVLLSDGDGRPLQTFELGGWVRAAGISRDGRRVAGVDSNDVLWVWDASTGEQVECLVRARSFALALTGDGSSVVMDVQGRPNAVWQVSSPRPLDIPLGPHDALAVNADGSRIVATGGPALATVVWDWGTGTARYPADRHAAQCVGISANGAVGISGDRHGVLRCWRLDEDDHPLQLHRQNAAINTVAASDDGAVFVAGDAAGRVIVWVPGRQAARDLAAHTGAVTGVDVTGDGSRLVSSGEDGAVRDWELDRLLAVPSLETGPARDVTAVALGASLVLCGGPDGIVEVFDAATGELRRSLDGSALTPPLGAVRTLAINQDGTRIVVAGDDPRIAVWGPSEAQPVAVLTGHRSQVCGVGVTADGNRVFAGDARGDVLCWDVTGGDPDRLLIDISGGVTALAVTPDGSRVAGGTGRGVAWSWDAATGVVYGHGRHQFPDSLLGFQDAAVTAVAISADGRTVAFGKADGLQERWEDGNAVEVVKRQFLHSNIIATATDGTLAVFDNSDLKLGLFPPRRPPLHAVVPWHVPAVAVGHVSADGDPVVVVLAHRLNSVTAFAVMS
jgi:WD40 repeat protein